MTRIVITGHTSFHNRGNEALIRATIDLLSKEMPGANFTVFSYTPGYDQCVYGKPGHAVEFLPLRYNAGLFLRRGRIWYFLSKKTGLNIRQLLRVDETSFKAIRECDCVVVSGGDLFSGYGLEAIQVHTSLARIGAGLRKLVVIYAQSINPYTSSIEQSFARDVFNQFDLITVREKISEGYLKTIGVHAPVYRSADPAFFLSPADGHRVNSLLNAEHIPPDRPFLGISASAGMAWYIKDVYDQYTTLLAELADHVVEKYSYDIVFIPHVIGPNQLGGDDRLAAHLVRRKMRFPNNSYLVEGEYNAIDLKGIIGKSQAFIGTRMHSTIAATSMLVPTIGLAYSIKAHGVLGELVQSRPIVYDIGGLAPQDLFVAVDDLIQNRQGIAAELAANLPGVKEKALITPQLIGALVNRTAPFHCT